jgi:RimJ/RimL family protein N-acetyltransferase
VARRVPSPDPTAAEEPELRLRAASEADAERLLEWRNDPEARAASRSTSPVSAEEHAAWFAGVLADPGRLLFVAEAAGEPVGQVRFDGLAEGRYEISVALAPAARGRGLAAPLISLGVARLRQEEPGVAVEAHVREGNARSLAAFRRAGFRPTGEPAEEGFLVLLSRGVSAAG